MKNEAELKIKTLRKAIIAPEMKWKCEVSLKEKLDRNFHLIPATLTGRGGSGGWMLGVWLFHQH